MNTKEFKKISRLKHDKEKNGKEATLRIEHNGLELCSTEEALSLPPTTRQDNLKSNFF